MNAVIQNIYDRLKSKVIYPITKEKAIFDDENVRLDNKLTDMSNKLGELGSKSSASAVSGNTAFEKINKLGTDVSEINNNLAYEIIDLFAYKNSEVSFTIYKAEVCRFGKVCNFQRVYFSIDSITAGTSCVLFKNIPYKPLGEACDNQVISRTGKNIGRLVLNESGDIILVPDITATNIELFAIGTFICK